MPIYEYYCPKCHRIFNFLAKTIAEGQNIPQCPKCSGNEMTKKVSAFSFVGGTRKSSSSASMPDGENGEGIGDSLNPRAERELEKIMAQAENIDENDPRQLGGLMRKMAEITGEKMEPEMEEAVRRLENGEDPEKIESELGDIFGDEEESEYTAGGAAGAPAIDDGLYSY